MKNVAHIPSELLPRLIYAGHFSSKRPVTSHAHTGHEFVLITKGRCNIQLEGSAWQIAREGDLLVMPPDIPHRQKNIVPSKTTYIVFDGTRDLLRDRVQTVSLKPSDPLRRWIEDLYQMDQAGSLGSRHTQSVLLLACLCRFSRLLEHKTFLSKLHPGMEQALAFINNHYTDPIRPAEIARQAGVSVSHLNLLFRTQFGKSPMKYVESLRIQRACRIMRGPYARANEAARACGYQDPNYFTRIFKKHTGMTPGQWKSGSDNERKKL